VAHPSLHYSPNLVVVAGNVPYAGNQMPVSASNPAVPSLAPLFGQHPAMSASAYYDISALGI
jgi:hypothetical protein